MRQRVRALLTGPATRTVMLAYATGTDLDQIAANYGVARLVVTPANPTATPSTRAVISVKPRLFSTTILHHAGRFLL